MNNTVITISVCDRLEFIKQTIDHLSKSKGVDRYKIIISVDPLASNFATDMHPYQAANLQKNLCRSTGLWVKGLREKYHAHNNNTVIRKEVLSYLESIDLNKEIIINDNKLNCSRAIKASIERGFKVADKVIHLEDDILISCDGLNFFQNMLDKYESTDAVAVSGYSKNKLENMSDEDMNKYFCMTGKWFPWGWATWKDKWESIKEPWDIYNNKKRSYSWDKDVKKWMGGFSVVSPKVSRTKHIGYYGTHITKKMWEGKFSHNNWIEDYDKSFFTEKYNPE